MVLCPGALVVGGGDSGGKVFLGGRDQAAVARLSQQGEAGRAHRGC